MEIASFWIMTCTVPIFRSCSWLVPAIAWLAGAGPVLAGDWQDHRSISQAAEQAVKRQLGPAEGRIEAVADPLDARMRLTRCDRPLEASLPYGAERRARVTAEVRCNGVRAWKLFVPVRLQIWQQVLVAAGPLQRGQLLSAADVQLAERTVSAQARGFILQPEQAIGLRLKRSLAEGDIITPGTVEATPLIQRGQQVVLEATHGALRVQMAGIALETGMAGQIIAVENSESGRRVEGIVRSARSVEVLLR